MTARQATAKVKAYLKEKGYTFKSVSSQTISFTDLARDGRIFTAVKGLEPLEHDEFMLLKKVGTEDGFTVDVFL